MSSQAPLIKRLEMIVPGEATANADAKFVVGRVPFDATVKSVTYTPDALITGADTNTRRVAVVNRKLDGAGTPVIAELQFNNAVNAAAFDEKPLTLSATAANLDVAEGDVLEFFSDAVLTGIADPGGLVVVEISRR